MYKRKTRDRWDIETNWGYGWETECSEYTWPEAKQTVKEYRENKSVYTVSQIEVGNLKEILDRKKEFLSELEIERRSNKAVFAALLVTDITQLSSILMMSTDPKFQPFITFPKLENDIYFLKDVVSRKKQLIPLITEQVENYER